MSIPTSNSNLLRSAIADAKTVRASALANARVALTEAFAPTMREMLSQKIAEETQTAITDPDVFAKDGHRANPSGDNNRMNTPPEETVDEANVVVDKDTDKQSINLSEDDLPTEDDDALNLDDPANAGGEVAPEIDPSAVELDVDPSAGQEVDVVDTGAGTVKTVPPAGDAGALPGADADPNAAPVDGGEGDDLELESIIRELEDEAGSEESPEAPTFGDEAGAEGDDAGKSVGISTPQVPDDVEVSFDDAAAGGEAGEADGADAPLDSTGDDEEVNLEEILKELESENTLDEELTTKQPLKANTDKPQKGNFGPDRTGTNKTPSKGGTEPALEKAAGDSKYGKDGGDKPGDKNFEDFGKSTNALSENKSLKKNLSDAYKTVEYLKNKINEVNLLNAKLLYTNKLFRNFGLNNEQKVKIVEQLDLTKSVREVKLVYTTLAESFSFGSKSTGKKVSSNRTSITEGLASKATASTKPTKVLLTESDEMISRFQKLAGISHKK